MPATYDSISTVTVPTNTSQVNLSSIPQGYTDLVVIVSARNTTGSNTLNINFNDGNDQNWSRCLLQASGTAISSTPQINMLGGCPIGQMGFNSPSLHKVDIFRYSNTSTLKTFICNNNNDSNGGGFIGYTVGRFPLTSAITQINFYPTSGQIASGSVFSLYGILRA